MQPIEKKYCVQIVRTETGRVHWTSEEMSWRMAERTEKGALINLDTERFYVRIQPADEVVDEDY